jgi:mycothiol synthase
VSATLHRAHTFTDDVLAGLAELADRARLADGSAPFSDDLWHQARTGTSTRALHVTDDDGRLVGAGFVGRQGDRWAAEVVVDPKHRGRGHGGALVAELLADREDELWLWSHGDHPAARTLARRHGLDRARELIQMRRPLGPDADPVPEAAVTATMTIRTFVPGQDEPAWLAVNNSAFSWHPEQGSLTLDDVRAAEAEPWFDPAGFFLAVDDRDRIAGYHWTKVHPHDPSPESGADATRPVGEVYVLGVAESARGLGLGTALTAVGLRHLAAVPGVRQAMLYVEGDNLAALTVYERLGFRRYAVDVAYRAPRAGS